MHTRTQHYEILSQTMDLELIRTLAFCQTKNLVNADFQTYRARYLCLSLSFFLHSWPKSIKTVYSKCLKMEDTVRLRVQYLLDIVVHQQLNIHVHINSSEGFRYRRDFIRCRIWRKTWTHSYKALCLLKLSFL